MWFRVSACNNKTFINNVHRLLALHTSSNFEQLSIIFLQLDRRVISWIAGSSAGPPGHQLDRRVISWTAGSSAGSASFLTWNSSVDKGKAQLVNSGHIGRIWSCLCWRTFPLICPQALT